MQGKESLLRRPSADGLSLITDMCWRHTERKETKGTRGLPERHAALLETHGKEGNERNAWSASASRLFKRQHLKLHPSPRVTSNVCAKKQERHDESHNSAAKTCYHGRVASKKACNASRIHLCKHPRRELLSVYPATQG